MRFFKMYNYLDILLSVQFFDTIEYLSFRPMRFPSIVDFPTSIKKFKIYQRTLFYFYIFITSLLFLFLQFLQFYFTFIHLYILQL